MENSLLVLTAPRAIIFDWDDTLVDTWPFLWRLYQETFALFGYTLTKLMNEKVCREKAVRGGQQTFIDVMGEDRGLRAREYFLTTYGTTFIHEINPLPGAETTLKSLKMKGIPMGVVSNKSSAFLKHEITTLGWDHYFKAVVGPDVVGPKPSAAPLLHALSEMRLDASSNIWFIGDSPVDHETARNAGCYSIGFGMVEHEPDVSVADWQSFKVLCSQFHWH